MMATGGACSTLSSEPSRLLYDREGSLFRFSRSLLCRPHALADLARGRHADHRRRQGPRHHVHRPHSAPPITEPALHLNPPPTRGALAIVGWRGLDTDGGGQEAILRRVVVIGDGAKWIWEHVAGTFG